MGYSAVAEGPVRITKATIEGAWKRRAESVRLLVKDAECRGLVLVVNPTSMTWRFDYRPRGVDAHTGKRWPVRTLTLGNPSTHAPDEARTAANKAKGQVVAGADPAAAKRAAAEAERRSRALTMGRLLESYEKALPERPKLRGAGLPCPRHAREDAARARAAVDAMDAHTRPVADLTAADVRRMLDATPGQPSVARARFGSLSRFLDWCQEGGHIEVNPCGLVAKARRPKAVPSRAHYLPLPDLARLWHAAAKLAHPVWRDLARFLIAVPCRRGEAAALDWGALDMDAAVWRQAQGTTKNGEAHRFHLHPLALDLLRARWKAAGEPKAGLVFPSPEAGHPILTFSAIKLALDGKAELTGWRWHDFRRSFATTLGEAGIAESVADAMLNHKASATRGGVLGVYQRADNWPGQVAAMQAWGTALAGVLAPKATPKPGNVVSMKRSKRQAA